MNKRKKEIEDKKSSEKNTQIKKKRNRMIEIIQSRGCRRKQRKKEGIEKSNGESKEQKTL